MDKSKKAALRKCRVELVTHLTIDRIWNTLVSLEIFTPLMLEDIQGEHKHSEKLRTMLDFLPRRGPTAFEKFLKCLRSTGFGVLADLLIAAELEIKGEAIPAALRNSIQGRQQMQQLPPFIESPQFQESVQEVNESKDVEMESVGIQESSGISTDVTVAPINPLRMPQLQHPVSSSEPFYPPLINPSHNPDQPSGTTPLNHSEYTGDLAREYRMESVPRGLMFIINNRDFANMPSRDGTDEDRDALNELFSCFGFSVRIEENLTVEEMRQQLLGLARDNRLREVDCLAVAILSHGSEGLVTGTNLDWIGINELCTIFNDKNCPALRGKPKFLIINACRGGVYNTTPPNRITESPHCQQSQPDASKVHIQQQGYRNHSPDFVVAYSTTYANSSYRDTREGSWFIQSLVKVFSQNARHTHVMDMLVEVNDEVSTNCTSVDQQIPEPHTTLRRKFYLNPVSRMPLSH